MIVRNVSSNLVKRLQIINPKTFIDLYDDGLQAEEIEILIRDNKQEVIEEVPKEMQE